MDTRADLRQPCSQHTPELDAERLLNFVKAQVEKALEQITKELEDQAVQYRKELVDQAVQFRKDLDTRDVEFDNLRMFTEKIKEDSEKDALLWGETEVSLVAGELLQQCIRTLYKEKRTNCNVPLRLYFSAQGRQEIKELAQKMDKDIGKVVYMADVVITRRNAIAHMDDRELQTRDLLNQIDRSSHPQGGFNHAAIRATRIARCLDLLERYPKLKDLCEYEWCFLEQHKEMFKIFELTHIT